jgi:hypothetical protein
MGFGFGVAYEIFILLPCFDIQFSTVAVAFA